MLTLEKEQVKLPESPELDLFIVTIGDQARKEALKYLYLLRHKGYKAEIDYLARNMKSQLKTADRLQAKYAIILGEDELAQGKAIVRDMETGDQQEMVLENILQENFRKE